MSDIAQQAAPEAAAAPYRWRWAAFAVVLAGYTLAMAIGLITGGRLGDLYGRRRVLLVGMAGFTLGSILCSIATQPGELIAFRVVQGLFGAIMLPQGLGVIRASFPLKDGSGLGFRAADGVFTVFGWYSPLKAGLSVLPQALGSVAGFVAAGAGLAAKLGRTLIHAGTAAIALGLAGVYLTLHEVAAPLTPWQLAPALALTGIGMGLVLAPFFDIILAGVEPAETGSASGSLTAIQQSGSALGAATFALAFLLPRRARPQWNGVPGPGDGTRPDGSLATTPAAEPA